jgi:biopolymer transport protein ExbB
MLTEFLLDFTLIGAEWVLWILVGLSFLSVGVALERAIFYLKGSGPAAGEVLDRLRVGDRAGALGAVKSVRGFVPDVIRAGLEHGDKGAEAVESVLASELARKRTEYDRFLAILATIGSNAPFIGLFGTVLGIIRAFADLAAAGGVGGPEVVMHGISEALVATAVGLGVAIPAVIAFNVFARWQRRMSQQATAAGQALLAGLKSEPPPPAAAAASGG